MLLRRVLFVKSVESLARRSDRAPPARRLPAPRRLSTVASPSAATPSNAPKPSRISSEESFVSKHFGKISLAVLGALGGLVYTYYLSIQDRKQVEQLVEREGALDPYEILQLRHVNALAREDFESVVDACAHAIHAAQPSAASASAASAAADDPPSSSGGAAYLDYPLPVELLCVALNLAMLRDTEARVAALFALGQAMEGRSARDAAKGAAAVAQPLRTTTTHRLVELLQATDQLPVEKQVCETGTVWPVRTYRRKLPADLVADKVPQRLSAKRDGVQGTGADDRVDLATATWSATDVQTLLLCRQVCAWGACYLDRDDD